MCARFLVILEYIHLSSPSPHSNSCIRPLSAHFAERLRLTRYWLLLLRPGGFVFAGCSADRLAVSCGLRRREFSARRAPLWWGAGPGFWWSLGVRCCCGKPWSGHSMWRARVFPLWTAPLPLVQVDISLRDAGRVNEHFAVTLNTI